MTELSHRERIFGILRGQIPDIIPSFGECAMDVTSLQSVLPPPTGDFIQDAMRVAVFYDNSSIDLDIGQDIETLHRTPTEHRYRYDTGAVWRESYQPTYCREAEQFPIQSPADIDQYVMPAPRPPELFPDMGRAVQAWKTAGYFVQGVTMGAWQGIYYQLASFENALEWMLTEPTVAARLFQMMGDYSLQAAQLMVDAGVDAVFVASDLGTNTGLIFSEDLFYQYVFPWLQEVADFCHRNGVICHLHSHGHIQDVMDGIIAAGVDLLNPVGPADNNDLAMFKERWGANIVLLGGISTGIAEMSEPEMETHVAEVMKIGCRGGRFMPRTESGIPRMPADKVLAYLCLLKKYRRQYGAHA